jgi:hypothetical protein
MKAVKSFIIVLNHINLKNHPYIRGQKKRHLTAALILKIIDLLPAVSIQHIA